MQKSWRVQVTSLCENGNYVFYGYRPSYAEFDTYAKAETYAKQRAAKDQSDVLIFESIAVAKAIVPAIEIEKL